MAESNLLLNITTSDPSKARSRKRVRSVNNEDTGGIIKHNKVVISTNKCLSSSSSLEPKQESEVNTDIGLQSFLTKR